MSSRNVRLSVYEVLAICLNVNKITRQQDLTCQNYLIFGNTNIKTSNLALLKISEEGYTHKFVNGIDYLQNCWYNGKGV